MLLTRMREASGDDRGSGLVAVIALTVVTGIIGVTLGGVSIHSLQTTNGVAGSVEARAAALAAISDVELMLRKNTVGDPGFCPNGPAFDSTGGSNYSVEIFSDASGTAWTTNPSCPTASSTRVKVVATGQAERATPGAGASGGAVVLEAIFQYVPQVTEVEAIDPAVYAYQIQGDLKNFVLGIEENTLIASDVQIRRGNFICTNGARVAGSVILAEGRAELTNCSVKGDVHVSQTISVDGASSTPGLIEGNAIAAGRTAAGAALTGTMVGLAKGTRVTGDIYAGGNVTIGDAVVSGKVQAARDASTSVSLDAKSRVGGSVLSTGTISNAGTVTGTRSRGVTTLAPPPLPVVPEWVDLPFTTATAASTTWWERGFQNVVPWSGSCSLTGNDTRWSNLSSYTTRTIVDATACTNGVVIESALNPTANLKTDVVFFAKSFDFRKLPAEASNATDPRRMYFVVPDNTGDKLPSCTNGAGNILYNNEANIVAPLALFLYSPCGVISDRNQMRGQIYGGTVEFRQQAQWTFVPATPPGIDFTAGGAVQTVPAPATLEKRISLRELSSGG